MDVAYIKEIGDQEVIMNRRNITIGIGCQCKVKRFRRFHQFAPIIDMEEPLPIETTTKTHSVTEKTPDHSIGSSTKPKLPFRIRIF